MSKDVVILTSSYLHDALPLVKIWWFISLQHTQTDIWSYWKKRVQIFFFNFWSPENYLNGITCDFQWYYLLKGVVIDCKTQMPKLRSNSEFCTLKHAPQFNCLVFSPSFMSLYLGNNERNLNLEAIFEINMHCHH